eukprot:3598739-Amphidinium_carterae.1
MTWCLVVTGQALTYLLQAVVVLRFLIQAKHIGNPAILMPLGFLVPLSAFFAGMYAVGSNVDQVNLEKAAHCKDARPKTVALTKIQFE